MSVIFSPSLVSASFIFIVFRFIIISIHFLSISLVSFCQFHFALRCIIIPNLFSLVFIFFVPTLCHIYCLCFNVISIHFYLFITRILFASFMPKSLSHFLFFLLLCNSNPLIFFICITVFGVTFVFYWTIFLILFIFLFICFVSITRVRLFASLCRFYRPSFQYIFEFCVFIYITFYFHHSCLPLWHYSLSKYQSDPLVFIYSFISISISITIAFSIFRVNTPPILV